MVFDEVHSDLESAGYEVQAVVIPAAAVNAPHGRDRVWFVAYSIDNRHNPKRNEASEKNGISGKHREEMDTREFDGTIISRDVTNTNGTPAQCGNGKTEERWKEQSGRIEPFGFNMEWQKFPTESPICGGDDGLSTQLDGITFSKWRAESIKAYGNAIVPQVAYQIFKALELCK
jgi:DNA (cytosine-5)-methyltransferase 1